MKKLKLITFISVSFFASSFLNSAFASNGNIRKESIFKNTFIIKQQTKSINSSNAFDDLQIIRFYTTCPDGTQQMAGVVAIFTNSNAQLTSVIVDYWGEELACSNNQLILWA